MNEIVTTPAKHVNPHKSKTITVPRGEEPNVVVSPPFTWDEYGKKSPHSGKEFLLPDINDKNLNSWLSWIGAEDLLSMVYSAMRRISAAIFQANIEDKTHEGVFNLDEWMEAMADFSAGEETKKEISDQILELSNTLSELMDSPEFAGDKGEAAEAACKATMIETNAKIKPLKIRMEEISAKYAARVAIRKEKKEKAKAEAEAKVKAEAQHSGHAVTA